MFRSQLEQNSDFLFYVCDHENKSIMFRLFMAEQNKTKKGESN